MQLQAVVVQGGPVQLKASQYVTAKLRIAFELYEQTMDPVSGSRLGVVLCTDLCT